MTDNEAARRRAIRTIGDYLPWRKDWRPSDIDLYYRGLEDLTPDEITATITDAIRERRTIPSVSQLRGYHQARIIDADRAQHEHDEHQRRQARDRGPGCPNCRREYPADQHAEWINTPFESEVTRGLTTCTEHNIAWRNTFPPNQDPGEATPDQVEAMARRGELGDVIGNIILRRDQHAATTGTRPEPLNPAELIQALTGENVA